MRITIKRITFNFGLSNMIPKKREKKGEKNKNSTTTKPP